jgi:hypothetical protein
VLLYRISESLNTVKNKREVVKSVTRILLRLFYYTYSKIYEENIYTKRYEENTSGDGQMEIKLCCI